MWKSVVVASLSILFFSGCATQTQNEKLNQDVLILTQKMEKLTDDLAKLEAEKAKQQKELESVKALNQKKVIEAN